MDFNTMKTGKCNSDQAHTFAQGLCAPPPTSTHTHQWFLYLCKSSNSVPIGALQTSLPFILGLITSPCPQSLHSSLTDSSMLRTFPLLCFAWNALPQISTGLSLSSSQMLVQISPPAEAILMIPQNPVHLLTQNSQHALLCSTTFLSTFGLIE